MKLIIIRGVPGTGKTLVANILGQRLPNSQVIHVDEFKLKAMKKGKSFEKSQEIAYERTLEKLYSLSPQDFVYITLEELICDKNFLNDLIKFVNNTKSKVYWFRLMRKIRDLLEVEASRERKIKNTKEDLFKLKQDIESLKIKNEYIIKNDNLDFTVRKILSTIR